MSNIYGNYSVQRQYLLCNPTESHNPTKIRKYKRTPSDNRATGRLPRYIPFGLARILDEKFRIVVIRYRAATRCAETKPLRPLN
ncbi:hypothetical protein M406DRAFT_103172 [Cryphonectria parasitica EP155]|uniref:Uncharacterized protein n=1 Tax=Cryphonectria parasitica (strain ATCC 38755 / EP155) TaxID=660469 RepID=A0A9P4XX16_CRYP1|nr:uncharacterized protein M406DRAFT_103172 [Cryphonectria parasitica EP155]KAF3762473.1 hypothetical protein M406DRAFT_103172 [Cryphonectria parasitica EP155]